MITSVLVPSLTAAVLLVGALRVHGALAWLVAAPFVLLRHDEMSWRRALLFGATFGVAAGAGAHAGWLAETAQRYFGAGPRTAWAGAIGLALFTGATQGALLGAGMRAAMRLRGALSIAAGSAVWVAWEWLGLHLFPYYPWASLLLGSARAHVTSTATEPLSGASFVLGAVAILGQPGVTFAMSAAGLAIGSALLPAAGLSRRVALAAAVAAFALVAALGIATRRTDVGSGAALCTIEAIDAEARKPAGSASAYAVATRKAAATWSSPPSVIVWPESAVETSPEIDAALRRRLTDIVAEIGSALLTGGPRVSWEASWNERRFNSAFLFDTERPMRIYDKRRTVPFAEYWPWPWIAAPELLQTSGVERGRGAALFQIEACRVGVLICFEAEAPALAREMARAGADALFVLSNDAVLPSTAADLEVAQVRLRAAETGLPVVRAANAGPSLVALPNGAVRVGRVEVRAARLAPAVQLAPWILGASLALGCVAAAAAVIARYRASARGA